MSEATNEPSESPGNPSRIRRCASDFIFGRKIGEGSFSAVYLAKDIHTRKEWAVKVCEKRQIIRERKQDYVKREREALNRMSGVPGFLKLFCTFQDSTKLFFVVKYAPNGTLLQLMDKVKQLDQISIRFYAAQILLAIEEMHAKNIIHRDLKPENILLDEDFHVLIGDFGSARIEDNKVQKEAQRSDLDNQGGPSRRGSFVGTAQYVSPEILRGKGSSESSDLWSFGCILYQMMSGIPPFQGANDYLIFQKINNMEISFPENFNSDAENLIRKLLVQDPLERIGINDVERYKSIRSHTFFEGVDFSTIRAISAPVSLALPAVEQKSFSADMKPGLDPEQVARLLEQDLFGTKEQGNASNVP
ncbi:3-phosphoinositide-dependent protein kinase 1-like [Armigeres subalbatus]|uniref:3-phosphoinositide-dependent protein kinase 1-like n=1 Tax=Armigeres subalbatus TaxID=124917 RepID=UPI002ECFFE36